MGHLQRPSECGRVGRIFHLCQGEVINTLFYWGLQEQPVILISRLLLCVLLCMYAASIILDFH